MIDNTFRISLRLISDEFDFKELIPEIHAYKVTYSKKGDNLTKNGSIKVKVNTFVIWNCHICKCIDTETNSVIISKLIPLLETLKMISVKDLRREIYISGAIENEQFGFFISYELISLLKKYKYALSFSGISYL